MIDAEIILESERLILRQHVMADRDAFCAMEMDPDVRRFVGGYPRPRKEAEQRFVRLLEPIANGLGMWATVLKSEGSYVGRCGIFPHFRADSSVIPNEAALGLYIATCHWNRGLATEAGRTLVEYGFSQLAFTKIVTTVEVGNDASAHVVRKLGFELRSTETGPRSFYHFVLDRP